MRIRGRKTKEETVNDQVNKLKEQMKTQQAEIEELKTEIKKKRAEIETTYHYEVIREKEDELQNLKRIHAEVKSEQATMERIIAEQHKAIGAQRENDEEASRKQDMMVKLREVKVDNRKLQERVNMLEKDVKAQHNLNVKEKMKLREGQQLIDGNRGKQVENAAKLAEEVEALEVEINEMKKQGDSISHNNADKFDEIERIKRERKRERDRLEQICKEKDKLARLNALKLNSVKRTKRYNQLKPMGGDNEAVKENVETMHDEDVHIDEARIEGIEHEELPQIGGKKAQIVDKPLQMKK